MDEASVMLRIYGDDLDPEEITRLLGCEPWDAGRTGELKVGAKRSWTVRRGYWKLRSERSETDVAEQIPELLARLTQDLGVWEALASRYKMDLFCGLFLRTRNRGVEFDAALLKMICERHLKVGFDIYGPEVGAS